MSVREHLIAGIKRQQELLNQLILTIDQKDAMDEKLRDIYERKTKEVENNLKKLRKIATQEILREIRVFNKEDLHD